MKWILADRAKQERKMYMMNSKTIIKRGGIYMVDFKAEEGSSIQSGVRPAIVVGNELGIANSTYHRCIPLTSKLKRLDMPTHVLLTSGNLKRESMAVVESEMPVDEFNIKFKIGEVSKEDMDKIDCAIAISEGIHKNPAVIRMLIKYSNVQFA
jgi:mRNA interferase MazF